MKHDYTALDRAIIAYITAGKATFTGLTAAVAEHSDALARDDAAPGWRIVDRRLQALRKAGQIRYKRGVFGGWVLADKAAQA